MVVGYTDTSSLWCDGIAASAGIRTSAYVSGSMHCSGGSHPFRQRLRPTAGSPARQANRSEPECGGYSKQPDQTDRQNVGLIAVNRPGDPDESSPLHVEPQIAPQIYIQAAGE